MPLPESGASRSKVPFLAVDQINARHRNEFEHAFAAVLHSGHFILGQNVANFESLFAEFCGTRHCSLVGNGLDALELVLAAWVSLGRLHKGDSVIVPANSFIASALAVTRAGLTVQLCDVDADSFNLTTSILERAITSRTRVVMPVHLYGRLADPESIVRLCRDRNIMVLEDAAQAHGAVLNGVRAGAFGDASAFSFYPTKNLGALGDAGCIVTNDSALDSRVRALRNYGSSVRYRHDHLAGNSRTDELQAAMLAVKLRSLDADNEARRSISKAYSARIRHPLIVLPAAPKNSLSHVWHVYVIQTTARAQLMDYFDERGIQTVIHYPLAIHKQPAYEAQFLGEVYPNAERFQSQVLSIPISPVMSDVEVERVIDAVNHWPEGANSTP